MDTTIKQKLTKLFGAPPSNPDVLLLDQTCPQCGRGPITCVYADLGSTDFYDNYVHLCSNPDCEFILHHESYTGSVGGRPDDEEGRCCFCRRSVQLTF